LWIEGLARLQAESVRFWADRAAKDMRMPLRLAASKTPVDALGTATTFAFEAARDYLAESQRLAAIAAGDFESAAAAVI